MKDLKVSVRFGIEMSSEDISLNEYKRILLDYVLNENDVELGDKIDFEIEETEDSNVLVMHTKVNAINRDTGIYEILHECNTDTIN